MKRRKTFTRNATAPLMRPAPLPQPAPNKPKPETKEPKRVKLTILVLPETARKIEQEAFTGTNSTQKLYAKTMTITPIQIRSFSVSGALRLDPFRVHLQDIEEGKGRVTIECFSRAWACYWPAMGKKSIKDFLLMADADYIEGAFHSGMKPTKHEREYLKRIVIAMKEALAQIEG